MLSDLAESAEAGLRPINPVRLPNRVCRLFVVPVTGGCIVLWGVHAAGTAALSDGSFVMLVITRREGEEVVIGDPRNPIGVVRIASIKGERVRVAFDFPRDVQIHRREVADQIASGDAERPADVIATIKPAVSAH